MTRLPPVFRDQARHCAALGSDFMAMLLTGLADRWPVQTPLARRMEDWPAEDIGPGGASLPLRLAGGLHALVLSGRAPELAAHYPPAATTQDALLAAVTRAMSDHHGFLGEWMDSPPQTNEIRRSVALIPVAHWLTARFGRPIELLELGASGGLNLWFDHFALDLGRARFGPEDAILTLAPDWTGPMPKAARPEINGRRGCDLNPLDPTDAEDALRLLAYLWPDQPERLARTRAALGVARPVVDRAEAADWLAARRGKMAPMTCRMIYHTVAWQYFPPETRTRATGIIEAAGAEATDKAPLAWLGMENDGGRDGARLSLRLWPGDTRHDLGRVDFHGRWLRWQPPEGV